MLMSYLAMRVTRVPFTSMQECYDSDFTLSTRPGTTFWAAFENGDELWQKIYNEKLKMFEEYHKLHSGTLENQVKWLLLDNENAAYTNYFDIS